MYMLFHSAVLLGNYPRDILAYVGKAVYWSIALCVCERETERDRERERGERGKITQISLGRAILTQIVHGTSIQQLNEGVLYVLTWSGVYHIQVNFKKQIFYKIILKYAAKVARKQESIKTDYL